MDNAVSDSGMVSKPSTRTVLSVADKTEYLRFPDTNVVAALAAKETKLTINTIISMLTDKCLYLFMIFLHIKADNITIAQKYYLL